MTNDLYIPFKLPKTLWHLKPFESLFLIGSCFSENMLHRLNSRKFKVYSNPHGILFDTLAIEQSISDVVSLRTYTSEDLFQHQELWSSWNHHSKFSSTSIETTLKNINNEIVAAHNFLLKTNHIVITLGSSFSYSLVENQKSVANCHKVPQPMFNKELISIETINTKLLNTIQLIKSINPKATIIFTISPVRHLRDGVIENNRSKARLIEAVHSLLSNEKGLFYFPAYEIMIDVLRDYRFYDIDFTHPNIMGTNIVFDYFMNWCTSTEDKVMYDKLLSIYNSKNHKTLFPDTNAHKTFKSSLSDQVVSLQKSYPGVDFSEEISHFNS